MARFKVPNEVDMRIILNVLFDGMDLKEGGDLDYAEDKFLGVYIDDEGKPVTACMCDMPFAAYSSSSLTMLPPPVAEDAIKSGALEGNQMSNLAEVFNILSRLFMSNDTDHLKFENTYCKANPPGDLESQFADASKKASFEIDIPRYGSGTVTMLVA